MALDLGRFPLIPGGPQKPPVVTPTAPLTREQKLNLESVQGLTLERGPVGQPRVPTGTFGNLGDIQTSGTGGDFAMRIGAAPTAVVTPSVYAMSHQLPTIAPEEPRATTAAPEVLPKEPATPATAAATKTATKELSNFEKAIAYSIAGGDQRPEVVGTRFQRAYQGLNAETAAQAAATHATTAQQQTMTPHVIAQEEEIDPLTGMSTRNKNIYGTYNPESKAWEPVKLPTIAAKAPLPPKADLKAGQVYPGYGKWTGTGFIPQ